MVFSDLRFRIYDLRLCGDECQFKNHYAERIRYRWEFTICAGRIGPEGANYDNRGCSEAEPTDHAEPQNYLIPSG
jgi:hypothetical protein